MKNDEDLFAGPGVAGSIYVWKTLRESPIARVGIGAGILFFVGMFSWAIEEHGWIKGFEAGMYKGAGVEMAVGVSSSGVPVPALPPDATGVSKNPEYQKKISILNKNQTESVPTVGGDGEEAGGLVSDREEAKFAGKTGPFSPSFPAPPMPGVGGRYLGTEQILRVDGKSTPVIRCKSGYDSVLLFPGKKVRKIFLGGYSWKAGIGETAGESLVILDPPDLPPVASNLVVVFASGVSVFRLKLVDQEKPFMARTVVRFNKNQRPK